MIDILEITLLDPPFLTDAEPPEPPGPADRIPTIFGSGTLLGDGTIYSDGTIY